METREIYKHHKNTKNARATSLRLLKYSTQLFLVDIYLLNYSVIKTLEIIVQYVKT